MKKRVINMMCSYSQFEKKGKATLKKGIGRGWEKLRRDPRNLFYLISAAGILVYIVLSFRYGGRLFAWMIQENAPEIRFIDYFSHLDGISDPATLYQHVSWDADGSYAAVFPPLAYCMYFLLYRLTAMHEGMPAGTMVEEIPGALTLLTIYLIFNAVIFYLAIEITGRKDRKKDLTIFSLLMLSAIFAGSGYLLANSTMLVVSLLMAGLQLKDSTSAVWRETGLVLLAVSVAMKIYPAVFGLVFLKERKYKELIRLCLYSLLLFFVPFVFFGGVTGFRAWWSNLNGPLQSASFYGRPQFLKGVFYTLIMKWTGRGEMALSSILTVAVCLVWVWLAWRSKSSSRSLFFLVCIMVFYPSSAYRYTLAYFSIPLVMILKEEPVEKAPESFTRIISILYGLLFTIPVWWLLVMPMDLRFTIHTLTSVEIYLYLVTYVLIGVMTGLELTTSRWAAKRCV